MSETPFASAGHSIGVTVVTSGAVPDESADVAVIRLAPAPHEHPPGAECIACAAAGDVRAMLFDLLQEVRLGIRQPFSRVIIDAHRVRDPQRIADRLGPGVAAVGLRDHTVARSFHLSEVI